MNAADFSSNSHPSSTTTSSLASTPRSGSETSIASVAKPSNPSTEASKHAMNALKELTDTLRNCTVILTPGIIVEKALEIKASDPSTGVTAPLLFNMKAIAAQVPKVSKEKTSSAEVARLVQQILDEKNTRIEDQVAVAFVKACNDQSPSKKAGSELLKIFIAKAISESK